MTMSHYFDHAATTPMRPSAISAWNDVACQIGNPSAIHGAGRAARKIVEESRETIAAELGVDPSEVVFTSGGTEADNMAVLGIARARRAGDPRLSTVLLSPIEHHAVLDAAYGLVGEGFTVIDLPVNSDGVIDLDGTRNLVEAHADRIALATCMWVNNEIGTIQPIEQLADIMAEHSIPYHCDAVQAGWVTPANPAPSDQPTVPLRSGLVSFALSAHKIGGPMGIGALILPRTIPIQPIYFGGGQERKLRSGTVPVPLVASFAAAIHEAVHNHKEERTRLTRLHSRLESILTSVNADIIGDSTPRTPSIAYALFPGCSAQDLIVLLDQQDIFVSTGSACTAGAVQPSHVLTALGRSEEESLTGLRFSLGWPTTDDDLDALATALPSVIARARRI